MSIKVGESWVRWGNRAGLVTGSEKTVTGVEHWIVDDRYSWAKSDAVPCHPPRDKKPPRKVTWKECEAWILGNVNVNSGPTFNVFDKDWRWYFRGELHTAPTRIGVVIKARAAMRRKERGK